MLSIYKILKEYMDMQVFGDTNSGLNISTTRGSTHHFYDLYVLNRLFTNYKSWPDLDVQIT